jgi:DNA-directed RNA polymerase subunit RPC12/RpoP
MTSPAKALPQHAAQHEVQMGFEEMIIDRTKAWAKDYDDANLPRMAEGFTMTMRDRGDYYSYFNMRPNMLSQWRVIPGKGMITFPIIGRSVRAKTATAVSTKIQVEVEAVRESIPEKAAAAELARNIARYCRDKNWTKDTEAAIATLCQTGRFCFVLNDYKTQGGMIVEIPETEKRAVKSGDTVYTCSSCGMQYTPDQLGSEDIAEQFKDSDLAESEALKTQPDDHEQEPHNVVNEDGETESPDDQDQPQPEQSSASDDAIDMEYNDGAYAVADDQQSSNPEEAEAVLQHTAGLTCPECGTNTLVMDQRARYESVDALTGNYGKRDCGFMDSRVVSPYLIRFDTYNCLGFDYKRAAWFNYHPLVPAYELLSVAPHLAQQLETNSDRWSDSARLHFELNNQTSSSTGYSYRSKNYRLDELVEVNVFWIQPHACFGFREPVGFTLPIFNINDAGEWIPDESNAQFEIQAGETIDDAMPAVR